jgi:cytochrome P450
MSAKFPPGPKGHFLWGSLRDFTSDTLNYLREIHCYGDMAHTRFGPFNIYFANSPASIHEVLVTNADKFQKSSVTKWALKRVLGTGLFTNDGDFWKRQRKLVQPAFHSKRIGAYADVIVNYTQAMVDEWQEGTTLEIDHEMTELTMRVITKTLFDADVAKEAHEISEVITELLAIVNNRSNSLIAYPDWLPLPQNRRLKRLVERLDQLIQGYIDQRRASGEDKGDLLSMLLMAQDEDDGGQMTDKQVRDEAITLFGAGHETTAVALTWTWYLLSQHPEIEAKLHSELDAVLGGQLPTLEDLARLPYTQMIIKEAMRLYPPAWGTSREATEEVTISGYPIKKRENIVINIYGVHYDEKYFPEPEKFDPERFSPENEKNIPKYAHIPFGAGPRVCIGNMFAMMEAQLVLATVAQRLRLTLATGHQVVPTRMFTLRPKFGMKMIVAERQHDKVLA